MNERFEAEGITLICADCLDILPGLSGVDAVITDPPYGIAFEGSKTKNNSKKVSTGNYCFDDTPEYIENVCVRAIEFSIKSAKRVALTPGIRNARLYPIPDAEGVFFYPSGANRCKWGFAMHQPIFYYGKCPHNAAGNGMRPLSFSSTEAAEEIEHPCPKPIGQIVWLVKRVSLEGETVCDPFMGSGTTCIACIRTGRHFIGIEKDPVHFATAVERIKRELSQPMLPLLAPEPQYSQETMI